MNIPTLDGEVWRIVPGHPNYYASSLGRIWSRPRERTKGGLLKLTVSTRGKTSGRLLVGIDQRTRLVHQVVAAAFHGPCPDGHETRHLDGDMLNNRADNLAWGTHAENVADAVRHGTHSNVAKDRCPAGHPLSDDYRNRRGGRVCRPCANRQSREYRARQR